MKRFLRILLVLLIILAITAFYNYPKLNIVSGYAAKNAASTNFIAGRSFADIAQNDNNMPLIKLAEVTETDDRVSAKVFGLMDRKTFCREGLGCVLIDDEYDINTKVPVPERRVIGDSLPFPYGNLGVKDTVFENVDYKKLTDAVHELFIDNETQRTRTVLVAYKNNIIAEEYAPGFSADTPILGWSMTKSVLATLYGILEYQGKINMDYKPFQELDLTDVMGKDPREFIPLDDLMRMSSGMEWDEDYASISDVTKMLFLAKDMTKAQTKTHYTLDSPKKWNYSSGTTNLLSGILRGQFKTYQEYLDFPYSALIDRMGMNSMLIEADMSGNYVGSSYGWANTRDWAKFGLLYLNRGNWNGEQIFRPEWVDYVAKPTAGSDGTYGAHFWLNAEGKYPDAPRDLYSANGFQGQRVFIIPSKNLVIVRTGLEQEPDFDANDFLKNVLAAIN